MKLPNFVSPSSDRSSKIGHDFGNKVVQKLTLSINIFYKKRAPKQLFFIEKKIQTDSDAFDINLKLGLFDKLSLDGDTKFGNFI